MIYFSCFYVIICYWKEKSWFIKFPLTKPEKHLLVTSDVLTACSSNDAHSSTAPLSPIGL